MLELTSRDFLTSDLHIGSCPWPYSRWYDGDAMAWSDAAAEQWDTQAGTASKVVVLGDAIDGKLTGRALDRALDWYAARVGTKVLVPGNHDAPHPMHGPRENGALSAWEQVFDVILPPGSASLVLGGRRYAASHFPASMKYWPEWKHVSCWDSAHPNRPILHGHTHSTKKTSRTDTGRGQVNVGWSAWRGLAPAPAVLELLVDIQRELV